MLFKNLVYAKPHRVLFVKLASRRGAYGCREAFLKGTLDRTACNRDILCVIGIITFGPFEICHKGKLKSR